MSPAHSPTAHSAAGPWLAHYEPGVPHQPTLPSRPFHAFLEVAAATAPGFPALTFLGRSRSYGEVFAQVGRAAGAMARDGVLPGSVVLVALPTCPAQIVAIYAALAVGAVALLVDPKLADSANELSASRSGTSGRADGNLAEVLARHDPALAVVHTGSQAVMRAIEASRTQPRLVTATPSADAARIIAALARFARPAPAPSGAVNWNKWLARARAPVTWPEVALGDPAFAVADENGDVLVVPHRQATAGAAMLRAWLADALPGGEKWLLLRPVADLLGVTAGLGAAVDLQSEIVLLTSTDDATVLDALSSYHPSFALAGGYVQCPLTIEESLRAWITVGDDASSPACRGWQPAGAAGFVTCNPVNGYHAPGTVGLPLPGASVRALDVSGAVVPPGVWGSLEVNAPNMPWPDRWQPTGVAGVVDEDGYVTLASS
jgi:long-chain acyl-CoA synthetase